MLRTSLPTPLAAPALARSAGAPLATAATPLTRDRLDVLALVGLVLITTWYAYGAFRLWRRGEQAAGALGGRTLALTGGIGILAIALLPPLDRLTTQLFAMQIGHYLLLATAIPPLLVLGGPGDALPAALPAGRADSLRAWWAQRPLARHAWEVLTLPLVVAALDILFGISRARSTRRSPAASSTSGSS